MCDEVFETPKTSSANGKPVGSVVSMTFNTLARGLSGRPSDDPPFEAAEGTLSSYGGFTGDLICFLPCIFRM